MTIQLLNNQHSLPMKTISLQRLTRAAILPFFVFICFVTMGIHVQSQTDSPDSTKTTVLIDSLTKKKIADTIPLFTPHYKHGLLSFWQQNNISVSKYNLQWINYTAGSDIVTETTNSLPLHLGNYGLWNTNSYFGSGISDQTVRWNGRSLGGIIQPTIPLDILPIEFLENIEIVTGVDAVAYSDNASGALINAQEIRYNTAKPYTRLWYSQGGNDYLAADGIFSQNIAPNLNLTLGFRRMSSRGRFTSSGIDAWNVRSKLQYTLSNQSVLSFTYMFTNHDMGAFGGLNTQNTDQFTSEPVYSGANTVLKRNDATITFSSFLNDDTTTNLTALLYYSNALTEQKNLPYFDGVDIVNLSYKQQEAIVGTSIRYEQYLVPKYTLFANSLQIGGEVERISTNQTVYFGEFSGSKLSGYGIFKQHLGEMYVKASLRATLMNETVSPSFGVGAFLPFGKNNLLKAEAIQNTNLRSIFEPSDQSVVNTVYSLQLRYTADSLTIEPYLFLRNFSSKYDAFLVKNQSEIPSSIEFRDSENRTMAGFGFKFQNSVWRFFYSVNAQYTYQSFDTSNTKMLPIMYGSAEVYYQHLAGSSVARLGVRVRGNSELRGMMFSPIVNSMVRYDDATMNGGFNGIDLYASAKLGDAYVRLTYMNLLNQTFGYMPIYPQLEGNFRISVGWAFLEQ
ncbi:MAG: hypothetical protein JNL36_09050 [Candidatus Kapabacteria bacterium]|nr:hypothetical protein [Candidatus Kapabacteria bacterium]